MYYYVHLEVPLLPSLLYSWKQAECWKGAFYSVLASLGIFLLQYCLDLILFSAILQVIFFQLKFKLQGGS